MNGPEDERELEERAPVKLASLWGIAPELTGGMDSVEWLRRKRDAQPDDDESVALSDADARVGALERENARLRKALELIANSRVSYAGYLRDDARAALAARSPQEG